MPEKTRFMDIYKHLSECGIEVYYPAQKKGECTAPYTVIKDAGTAQIAGLSSTQTIYDVMCYVPKEQFTFLEQYVHQVKEAMRKLQPMIMPTFIETASFYDDTVKGHMISMQYKNNRKIYLGGFNYGN